MKKPFLLITVFGRLHGQRGSDLSMLPCAAESTYATSDCFGCPPLLREKRTRQWCIPDSGMPMITSPCELKRVSSRFVRQLLFTTLLAQVAICGFGQDWNVSGDNFTTGKVGIGTSTPLYDLDIDRPTPYLRIHSSIYTNSPLSIVKKGGIIFNQENADKTAAIVFAVPPDYHVPGILFETKASWNVPGPGAFDWYDRMFIHPGGNIGIGTVSPNGKLSVYNNFSFNANETASGQDHIIFSGIDPGNGGYFGGLTWESGGRRRASIVATRENEDADYVGLAFFTKGTDGPGPMAESMRITRYGSVGIGTPNPDATLTVKGSIHTQEVLVDLSGAIAPDYVFEKGFTLLPLADLEEYIEQNKHLPDAPSASEMDATGLKLKEMNLLLLKKIEELTLYIIDQNKENGLLRERVKELEDKVGHDTR